MLFAATIGDLLGNFDLSNIVLLVVVGLTLWRMFKKPKTTDPNNPEAPVDMTQLLALLAQLTNKPPVNPPVTPPVVPPVTPTIGLNERPVLNMLNEIMPKLIELLPLLLKAQSQEEAEAEAVNAKVKQNEG